MRYPVLWQPGQAVIGEAETKRGAIACAARRISCPIRERWSATLADRMIEPEDPEGEITFVKTWFVSTVLRPR
jgi:hypothetical protein